MRIQLKPGRDKQITTGHPWLFRGGIAKVEGDGDIASVYSDSGRYLAQGFWNAHSDIAVRIVNRREPRTIGDGAWLTENITAAMRRRQTFQHPDHNAWRLVYSDADDLPGLTADRYDRLVVFRISSLAMWKRRDTIREVWTSQCPDDHQHFVPDPAYLQKEGVKVPEGEPIPSAGFRENSLDYYIDKGTQKTGYYLDQKFNRARIAGWVRSSDRVLDAFCYSGGFTLPLLRAGASVVAVDSSAPALSDLLANAKRNDLQQELSVRTGDVFRVMRDLVTEGEMFDMIIQDPPRLASRKEEARKAQLAYKDLFLHSARCLKPGGLLAGFSCSAAIGIAELEEALAWAVQDLNVEAAVLERYGQSPDHHVPIHFPQARYLSGFLARIG